MMKTKVCTKCGKRKKLTEFNFSRYQRKDGMTSIYYKLKCKECRSVIDKQKYKPSLFTQEKRRVYELHKEEIEAGVKQRINAYLSARRAKKNPKGAERRKERRAAYDLHGEQIAAGAREAWNIYCYHRNYIRNTERREAKREQRKIAVLAKEKARAEWKRKMAYYKTPEFKEEKRLRRHAKEKLKQQSDPNYNKKMNIRRRCQTTALTDGYIRRQLAKHTPLCHSDIPQELIDAKREHLKLKRAIRQLA